MTSVDIAVLAVVVLGFALVSGRARGWPVTMPIVLVGAGVLAHVTGLVRLDVSDSGIGIVGEAALAVLLFSDAVRIDVRALRRERGLPLRLLGIGLPLSILLGTGIGTLLLTGLDLWEAALLAAVLAPTDAALGQAVVENEDVPVRVRQSLNVESGLNDGLVLPAVLLFVALSGGRAGDEQASWPAFAAQQIGFGIATGVVVGGLGALLLRRAGAAGWVDGLYAQLATLALATLSFTVALAVGGNGFVAAFTGGLVFGALTREADHVVEYSEDTGQLLAAVSFFLFGNVLVPDGLDRPTLAVVACSLALLTVGRLLPVTLSLLGSGTVWRTWLFMGWFGPRGLASIVFGLLLFEEAVPAADELFSVIALTVLLSVAAHGATAGVGARRYADWYERSGRAQLVMAESAPMREHRTRGWRRPRTP